jgi:hypothetical protein
MISSDFAIKLLGQYPVDDLGKLLHDWFGGDTAVQGATGWRDEPPEDIFAAAFLSLDFPASARVAITSACRKLYASALCDLTVAPSEILKSDKALMRIRRLCTFIELAAPEELRGVAKAFLQLIIGTPETQGPILVSAVEAWRGYGRKTEDIPLWEDLMRHERVAAYAFAALLEVETSASRIAKHLVELWVFQIEQGWNIDATFLTRRAIETKGRNEILQNVFGRISRENPLLWTQIQSILEKKSYSRDWSKEIAQQRARRTGNIVIRKERIVPIQLGRASNVMSLTKPDWTLFRYEGEKIIQGVYTESLASEHHKQGAVEEFLSLFAGSLSEPIYAWDKKRRTSKRRTEAAPQF